MKYLNHITLNTGHVRKTYPSEIPKELYFSLMGISNGIFEGGTTLFDKYTVKGSKFNDGAILTVFDSSGEVPILTTAFGKRRDKEVWRLLHKTSTTPLATHPSQPVDGPYIADRLEVGANTNLEALKWTADFSRCMGWAILYPDKIRQ